MILINSRLNREAGSLIATLRVFVFLSITNAAVAACRFGLVRNVSFVAVGGITAAILRQQPNTSDQRPSLIARINKNAPRLSNRHAFKPDQIARFELPQPVEISRDHVSDVRITPHRAAGDSKHYQLAAGHLHRPGRNRCREPLGF
jgi:hypothetical protein